MENTKNQLEERVSIFMKENKLEKIIAFSGGADEKEIVVSEIIEDCMSYIQNYPVAILTGGTNEGVPRIANDIAKSYGIKTIGVLPSKGEKSVNKNLDLKLVIEPRLLDSHYGDDSEVFAKLSDGVTILGGGNGTAIEFYHMMKMNDSKIKHGDAPIYIAPIAGIGGISEEIYTLNSVKNRDIILPRRRVYDGDAAMRFLSEKLNLENKK